MLTPFLPVIIIFILSFALTGLIRFYLVRKAILDVPNERSSHAVPTPRGGGIAIAVSFFLAVGWLAYQNTIDAGLAKALLGGGVIVAAAGYWDDLKSIPASVRITLHLLAAIWALYFLGGFPVLELGVWKLHLGWMGSLFAVIGIVWFINLYNFMDGIDGLAGSEAFFVSVVAGIALFLMGAAGMALLCFLLAAAVLGFLIWNWPPAKIFMGDIASGLLGYIFGVLTIATANQHQLPILFWLTLLAVFILDTKFTLLRRVLRGERWYAAHRQHVYQRLARQSASHVKVTAGVIAINLAVLAPLVYVMSLFPVFAPWLFLSLVSIGFMVWLWVVRKDKEEL